MREGPPPEAPRIAVGPGTPGVRLLDQVRTAIRLRHCSRRTEKAYTGWIRRILSHLAVEAKVSASTQNQALSALLFLYGNVLNQDLGWLDEIVRAKRPARLPVVLTREEVRALLRLL